MKRSLGSNKQRGAALLTSMIFTLIISLLVGGALTLVMSHVRNVWAKNSSESALLMAEAGINDELSYISRNLYNATISLRSTQPVKLTGEPYKGRPGTLPGVTNGKYWVFASGDVNGTTAWDGRSRSLWIVSTALVNGAYRRVKVGGNPRMFRSPFEMYAIFGYNSDVNGATNAVTLANGDAIVEGTVGTNGKYGNNAGSTNNVMSFTAALNFNTANFAGQQFTNAAPNQTAPISNFTYRKVFPSVTTLLTEQLRKAGINTTTPWDYLRANNNNNRVRQYAAVGGALTPTGTVSAGFLTTQNMLRNGNQNNAALLGAGGTNGSFQNINSAPDGFKYLIFPPGDYYFTSMELTYIANQKIIIDDAGLTVGGNPNKDQIRFFFDDRVNQNDFMQLPIAFTAVTPSGAGDPSIFRFLYNKAGKQFEFRRSSGFPTGQELQVFGAVYSITGENTTQPTYIRFNGESAASGSRVALIGSLIADTVTVQGYGRITHSSDLFNENDVLDGIGFIGGYDDEG